MARKSKSNPHGLDKKYYVLDSNANKVVFETDDFHKACDKKDESVHYMVFAR